MKIKPCFLQLLFKPGWNFITIQQQNVWAKNIMTIKYTNTIEDLVELQNHLLITSKTLKNQMRFRRFFVPSLILIMLIIISFKESSFGPFVLGVVIFSILIAWFPSSMRKSLKKTIVKTYGEGKNNNVLCEHTLEIVDDELRESNPTGQEIIKLSATNGIYTTEHYTFIYVTSLSAHIIPVSKVLEGDYQLFVQALKNKMAHAP
ncbi:MAG: YcxB family protein [Lentisphaeraceae bacterium]|nr:YcxB family protein [Lentisphaeraceae bacterium]